MKINIGVIGFSHFHIHMFLEEALQVKGARIMGVFDEEPEIGEAMSVRYQAPAFKNMDSLLGDADINIIIIAAVNSKKADIIIKALGTGKAVIVDKPLVINLEDLGRIEQLLKHQKDAKLYMMLTERYNSVLYTVRKCIDAGDIGNIVNCILLRPHKLKPETRPEWFFKPELYGGLINDLGVHDLDIIRWMTGSEVEEILGASKSSRRFTEFKNFEDNCEVLLRMQDGSTAFVRVDWLTPDAYPFHGDCRLLIVGTKGQIEAYTVGMHESGNVGAKVILCTNSKAPVEVPIESRAFSIAEDFFSCILDDRRQPVVKTEDVLRSTRAALEAQIAADRG